jgi:hypothetical protein
VNDKRSRDTWRARRLPPLKTWVTSALLVLVAAYGWGTSTASADPTFGVMNASGGIYWRSGPDWNTPVAVAGNGFYPDTIIAVHCYQGGAGNVPGSTDSMWEQASVAGGSGTGSGWINEHFINDGAPINQPSPGAPPCGATAPPGAGQPPATGGPPPASGPLPAGSFAVMNASGGIYWRSGPDWNTPVVAAGNGFYPDTIITVECYRPGVANVPGSSNGMWELAHVASGRGNGSGWINGHFINDGSSVNQPSPGVQPCAGSTSPTRPSAPAAGRCYGDYCSGRDPEKEGCAADSTTLAFRDLSGARLELRWSARCKTEWAKWIQYPVGLKSDVPTALFAIQDTGYTQSASYDINGAPTNASASATNGGITTSWTPMIYSPVHLVRAVVNVQCGDRGLLASAVDCYLNGKAQTEAR